jgi:hypothetical protein
VKVEYTDHAEFRIRRRKITKDEVEITIKSPEKLTKEGGRYYASKNIGRGVIEVVYEKETYIKVITVYWL